MSDKKFNNRNLREAIDNSRMTREQIADKVQCDTSSITKYYNGDRYPKTDVIIKLAKLFNVSTDYLLGVTDVATTDKDLKFVCDYTGLDEKSINFFHFNNSIKEKTNFNEEAIEFLQFLISKIHYTPSFSMNIYDVRANTTVLVEAYEKSIKKRKNGFAFLSEDEIADFNNLSNDEKIQFLLNDKDSEVELDDLDIAINGLKYRLRKFFDDCLDEFAVSASGYTVFELNELENEYYKKNV